QGNYRNQWYISDRETPCLLAIGIHGQWLYIDLKRQIVIVKLSSQAEPVNEALDAKLIRFFGRIAKSIG
ncbi:MAG: 6-aminohexanoate hydrolase, partial [Gammaproteobacteria bacterium]